MGYTVKQVAAMSGVSVRALHFYDETSLLKPAYVGANGYRYYEEPQLLKLQQILFYRELGFELKRIKRILGRRDFEKVAALASHRKVLEKNLERTRRLIETIDQTIEHLKGIRKMKSEEMFAGFSVAAGAGRSGERVKLGEEPIDCKVSGKDTKGALCIFEFTGSGGGPRAAHLEEDEWIYVVEGEFDFVVGTKRIRLGQGESIFIPRNTSHVWATANGKAGKIINVYQPAGRLEEFFASVTGFKDLPTLEQVRNKSIGEKQLKSLHNFFASYGMDLQGPPLGY
ncbi:MAG TPA: MerR family transcriptional regulator [Verrucomicrobiae bacterium]|jgi:DNA-binding transcriptional MerR regulator|nr:MerR family transcriptional regulator [Verrucomicrobiae bacterium]